MFDNFDELKDFLDQKAEQFNTPAFIPDDPVSIPHQFTKKQDIEIMGFIAAILAWGQRKTIINKCQELISLMDRSPYDFIINHQETDLKRMLSFKHRTFNPTDLLYFLAFFKNYYHEHESLEWAFAKSINPNIENVQAALEGFYDLFFSLEEFPVRTKKHIASPRKNSSCKRLNMFLRWMVRDDNKGVDFGLWKNIRPSQLLCPLDIHVSRVARKLGLIEIANSNWKAVLELTHHLKQMDAQDPVKYDYALFGLGIYEKF